MWKPNRLAIAVVVTVLAASATVFADVLGHNDRAVVRLADPVLDNMLMGIANLDYDTFVRDFDATMRKQVTKEEFQKIVLHSGNTYGAYQSRKLLGFLNKQGTTAVLWKARFSGLEDDVLITLILYKKGEKIEVTGFWVD